MAGIKFEPQQKGLKFIMKQSDIQLLKQLWNGYHLEPKELERAKQIVDRLTYAIKER